MANLDYMQIIYLFISGIFSYTICYFLVPFINKFGEEFELRDFRNYRKKHNKSLVRVGGIAIFIPFILTTLISSLIGIFPLNPNLVKIIIIGSISYFFLGLIDDIFNNISARLRLLVQVLFASAIIRFGFPELTYQYNYLFQNSFEGSQYFLIVISILWIVGLINAINWVDGLDGLLIGTSIISSIGIFIISLFSNNVNSLFYSLVLISSCLGFARYNKYPAKIILGDCGSYLIGFILSIISVNSILNSQINSSSVSLINFLFSIIFLLFIPLSDMVRVITKRIIEGKNPFKGDRAHIHYLLIDRGIKYENVLFLIYSISSLALIVIFYIQNIPIKNLFFFAISSTIIFNYLKIRKNQSL